MSEEDLGKDSDESTQEEHEELENRCQEGIIGSQLFRFWVT